MSSEQKKALDRIKKCLRLAGSSEPHEAAAAMRQAQMLMEKYNLSLDDVSMSDVGSMSANSLVKKSPTEYESRLANICRIAFGCRVLFCHLPNFPGQWRFIGCGPAPELAAYAFQVLLRQLKKDRSAYIRTALKRVRSAENKTARADVYCLAWVMSAQEKVDAIAINEKQERAIELYLAKHHPKVTSLQTRSPDKVREQDAVNGHLAGQNAKLYRGMNGSNDQPTALEHL